MACEHHIANGVPAGVGPTRIDEFPVVGALFLYEKMSDVTRADRHVARSREYDSTVEGKDVSSQCLLVE
jgi:hypothetical protein